jgi:hypothetical protein
MKKVSSRQGRFKKKLVSLDSLLVEAPSIEASLRPFVELYLNQKISAPELCGIYILLVQNFRRPYHFLGQEARPLLDRHEIHFPCANLPLHSFVLKKIGHLSVGDVFNLFSLRSTPQSVNRALIEWSNKNYLLDLSFNIPSPFDVLTQQSLGKRCVSLLYKKNWSSKYILGERDALSFLYHDLIHADHFYFQNNCFESQISFYGFLEKEKIFFTELIKNPKFYHEFEYLIADMNAYPIHSLKCLKSAIIHYGSNEMYLSWIESFEVNSELRKLNTKDYLPERDDQLILGWLEKFKLN